MHFRKSEAQSNESAFTNQNTLSNKSYDSHKYFYATLENPGNGLFEISRSKNQGWSAIMSFQCYDFSEKILTFLILNKKVQNQKSFKSINTDLKV